MVRVRGGSCLLSSHTLFNDLVGRVIRPARTLSLQRSMALSGSPLGEPGIAIPSCAAWVKIETSVLNRGVRPLSSSSGEKPSTESRARSGARVPRRLRASSAAIVLRLKWKDCPSFGRDDEALRAQGRRDGRAAHGHRVMPGARSWPVRAVSIGSSTSTEEARSPLLNR